MITKSLVLAIMMTESGFNPRAVSSENAKGLMQLTEIAVREVHLQTGWEPNPNLYDPETNIKYGVRLLEHYQKGNNSIEELLAQYNGGSRQRNKIRLGEPLATETANYIPLVLSRRDAVAAYIRMCGTSGLPYIEHVESALAGRRDGLFKRSRQADFERLPADIRVPARPAVHNAHARCGSLASWHSQGKHKKAGRAVNRDRRTGTGIGQQAVPTGGREHLAH